MEDITTDTQVHANPLRVLVAVSIFLCSLFGFSQGSLSTSNKKALKLYAKADKKYKERDFEASISFLEEATSIDSTFFEAFIRMGSLYNALGQLDSVYSKFGSYLRQAPDPISSVLERMAFMSFDRGDYAQSSIYLDSFLGKVPEKATDKEIHLLRASLIFARQQLSNPQEINISELPLEINRYKLQYLPTMTVDGATMIYTKRDVFSGDEDIVVSHKKNGKWESSQSISHRINTPLNEGACTISADGRTMIFTSCDRRDAYGSCDLFISTKTGEAWSRPKNLGKRVNSRYWESQPSLSADGKTLYFTSNRPGGFGGRDLWVTKNVDGKWREPANLGKTINSFKDETTPFIHFNGKNLFFSSNSYEGMGGFDLFSAELQDSTWTKPKNLGYPINTFRDEVAFLVTSDGKEGYFAKEEQKNREILDSRIVQLTLPDSLQPSGTSFVVGKVMDAETRLPLKASIEIVDVPSNKKLYDSNSDSVTGEFYMVLPPKAELAGYIKRPGYLYSNFHFETDEAYLSNDTLVVLLESLIEGQKLVLKNIYFDTDSYELDERSLSELESVIQLLKQNPSLSIEINGHTDDIGNKEYNQLLSENRAKAVHSAIISAIEDARVTFKGSGDTQPLVPNTSDSNRQSNRRIEFRVIRLKQ